MYFYWQSLCLGGPILVFYDHHQSQRFVFSANHVHTHEYFGIPNSLSRRRDSQGWFSKEPVQSLDSSPDDKQ